MPVLNCPFPDCDFVTEDVDVVGAAAQLNIHAIIHQQGGGATFGGSTKQKPPEIERPTVRLLVVQKSSGIHLLKDGIYLNREQTFLMAKCLVSYGSVAILTVNVIYIIFYLENY